MLPCISTIHCTWTYHSDDGGHYAVCLSVVGKMSFWMKISGLTDKLITFWTPSMKETTLCPWLALAWGQGAAAPLCPCPLSPSCPTFPGTKDICHVATWCPQCSWLCPHAAPHHKHPGAAHWWAKVFHSLSVWLLCSTYWPENKVTSCNQDGLPLPGGLHLGNATGFPVNWLTG